MCVTSFMKDPLTLFKFELFLNLKKIDYIRVVSTN